MDTQPEIRIVPAKPGDIPLLLSFIRGLAHHLDVGEELTVSADDLHNALFGAHPHAEALIAWAGNTPAGYALFFQTYSTFRGKCSLYLEDLYVDPSARGLGVGKRLLSYLSRLTLERGCSRLEWMVLSSDEKATSFYESIGAKSKDEWTPYRLRGDALRTIAERLP